MSETTVTTRRPYRVGILGAGVYDRRTKTFGSRDAAIAFARVQANAAWTDATWLVRNVETDEVLRVSRDGTVEVAVEAKS